MFDGTDFDWLGGKPLTYLSASLIYFIAMIYFWRPIRNSAGYLNWGIVAARVLVIGGAIFALRSIGLLVESPASSIKQNERLYWGLAASDLEQLSAIVAISIVLIVFIQGVLRVFIARFFNWFHLHTKVGIKIENWFQRHRTRLKRLPTWLQIVIFVLVILAAVPLSKCAGDVAVFLIN